MVKVKPFKAYLANQDYPEKIIAKPYDVLNTEEAREEAGDNEASFYHVNKPEIDLEDDIEDKSLIYEKGKENLLNFIEQGHLVQDSECRMYVYGQKMSEGLGGHEQFGIVALSNIEDYGEG